MTTTVTRLVPADKHMLNNLTVGELDTASRQIKADVVQAVSGANDGVNRWAAIARVAWLWARRQDPKAQLQTYLDMEPDDLATLLGMDDDEEEPALDPTASSTGSESP